MHCYQQGQWEYNDEGVYTPYEPRLNDVIEAAYNGRQTHATWKQGADEFQLDFDRLVEVQLNKSSKELSVRRIDASGVAGW